MIRSTSLCLMTLLASCAWPGGGHALAAEAPRGAAGLEKPTSAKAERTYSSLDRSVPGETEQVFPAGMIKFDAADLDAVLKVYQELSRRTVVRSAQLPATKITVESSVPLTLRGALQTLDTALALNGIVMIPQGANHVKAVPEGRAVTEPAPIFDGPWEELPESGSYVTYIVELKEQRAQDVLPILQPLARLPNSILAIPEPEVLVLRDYSINVRQMLNVLRRLEAVRKSQPGRGA